ncbi:MAG TPA: hypothetical protein VFS23_09900 [Vicinamibacterales bacterium]|nr:hypothetical protein [Vicinamibacterales bacterium]
MRRSHVAVLTISLAIAGTAVLLAQVQIPPPNRRCLHDESETREDRTRRERAVELADDINQAQTVARRYGRDRARGQYRPLDELFNVPAPPDGFRVQMHTDGTTYSFSIKDTRDPCRYAVFSDQSTDIYEAVPTSRPFGPKLLTVR